MKLQGKESGIVTTTDYEDIFINFSMSTARDTKTSSSTKQKTKKEDVQPSRLEKALEKALDTRKFEIGLYWQRTAYFWAFIMFAFTGYFIILQNDKSECCDIQNILLFLISISGIFLSIAWFLVNKASKYWQENWEHHIAVLEDVMMGPLYKTLLIPPKQKCPLLGYSKYSISKINQVISFAVICVWFILWLLSILKIFLYCDTENSQKSLGAFQYGIICVPIILVFIFLFVLLSKCKSGKISQGKDTDEFNFYTDVVVDGDSS